MKKLLNNKVVYVTGGTQGIGEAIALRAAEEGAAAVVVSSRNIEKADNLLSRMRAINCEFHVLKCDVSNVDEAKRSVEKVIDKYGRIDCLVNAAGITTRGTLLETTPELLEIHYLTNFAGPFFTMAAAVSDMKKRKSPGTIVNILTMSSHGGQPYLSAYVGSKAALAAVTKNVAHAHRFDRIRINGLNIGWSETPGEDNIQQSIHAAKPGWQKEASSRLPMGKLGQPDEIADAVIFLLSERSGVVTGSIIDWDQNVVGTSD